MNPNRWNVMVKLASIAAIACMAAPLSGQAPARRARRAAATVTRDSTRPAKPPVAWPVIPVLPGALLPASRIVAFYGNPLSTGMGVLGALPPEQMLSKLTSI
ncbi:MAG: hypothetical protein ABUL71_02370, partial [Gemmatimonadota bacterium]